MMEAFSRASRCRSVEFSCRLPEAEMKYLVRVEESDEGFAVSAPGLPGCHSQGASEAEALANIADANREYLEVASNLANSAGAKPIEIEV
jgi:predicted RNase H-like HicB family nuclease